jgi:RNA polymerase sigma-70 factor (ECF subfamily)
MERRVGRRERVLDEYLAASARLGDRQALALLARRWERRLLGHAFRLCGEADLAGDIVQDAWLDIARSIGRLDDTAAFPAWALRIVTRRAADAIRRARRRRAGLAAFAAEPVAAEAPAPESAPSGRLSAALAALPPEQRAALALFYRDELSIPEIAAALAVPEGTVKTRLKAARDRLRVALGPQEEKRHEQA